MSSVARIAEDQFYVCSIQDSIRLVVNVVVVHLALATPQAKPSHHLKPRRANYVARQLAWQRRSVPQLHGHAICWTKRLAVKK